MLGVCYYPEHWPEADWAADAQRMAEPGIRYVRIGEFALSRIEADHDRYDWAWLDRALDTLGGHGLKVVLGTPTATAPKWPVAIPAPDGATFPMGQRRLPGHDIALWTGP